MQIIHPWWQPTTRNGTKARFAPKDPGENPPLTRCYVHAGTAARARWSRRNPWRRLLQRLAKPFVKRFVTHMIHACFVTCGETFLKIPGVPDLNMFLNTCCWYSPGAFWGVSRYLLNMLDSPLLMSRPKLQQWGLWNAGMKAPWFGRVNSLVPSSIIIKKSLL